MKKTIAFFLALSLLGGLAACSSQEQQKSYEALSSEVEELKSQLAPESKTSDAIEPDAALETQKIYFSGELAFLIPESWKYEVKGQQPYYYYNDSAFLFTQESSHPDYATVGLEEFVDILTNQINKRNELVIEKKDSIVANNLPAVRLSGTMTTSKSSAKAQAYCILQGETLSVFFFVQVGEMTQDFQSRIDTIVNSITPIKKNFANSSTSSKSKTDPIENSSSTEQAVKWYSSGTYKVGSDLPAGEYYVKSTGRSAYIQVSSNSSGDLSSIITNKNIDTFEFITISDGQYFKVTRGDFALSSGIPPIEPINGKYSSGMYRIGIDIPAGEYKIKSEDNKSAYYEVATNSLGVLSSILTNGNFEGEDYITVSNGQYLKVSRGEIVSK